MDLTQVPLGKLGEYYLRYKTKVEEIQKAADEKIKELVKVQEDLLAEIDKRMKESELENAKTPFGTFFYTTKTRVSKRDGEEFLKFVQENDRFDLVNIQPLKTACVDYIKEHDIVPPGCEYATWPELSFRRSS